jgi:hypothetical protein
LGLAGDLALTGVVFFVGDLRFVTAFATTFGFEVRVVRFAVSGQFLLLSVDLVVHSLTQSG